MKKEILPMEPKIKRSLRKERMYFVLLLISTILTGCSLIVVAIALGKAVVFILSIILILLLIVWVRHWIRVMTIRDTGIQLGSTQYPSEYEEIRRYAEQVGLWKMPEVFVTRHQYIKRPTTIGLFQKYLLVLPSPDFTDSAIRLEVIRELVRLRHNHEEKKFLLLLGSWIPFLRAAYLRACVETADRLALAQLQEAERVPALIQSIIGPVKWTRLQMDQYIEEKIRPASIGSSISYLFRHQPSVARRLATAGQPVTSLKKTQRAARMVVVLAGVIVATGVLVLVNKVDIWSTLGSLSMPTEQTSSSTEDLDETELMAAIQKGTLDEINQLIPTSDIEAVDADGDTALHYLGYRKSSEGLEHVFKRLLAAGADEDAVNEFGERPFITAVYSNNKELVELYLKHGEAINQQDDEKYTPLHHAVEGEGKQTVKLLLDEGANPALKNADGYTPLMMAQEYELDDIIALLKKYQTQTL
ncbi:ankyrin repeat domain-containing protein [Exiguobacterium undae]